MYHWDEIKALHMDIQARDDILQRGGYEDKYRKEKIRRKEAQGLADQYAAELEA